MGKRLSATRFLLLAAVWLSVTASVIGFFLPWVSVRLRDPGTGEVIDEAGLNQMLKRVSQQVGRVTITLQRGAETVTGELPDLSTLPERLSGFEIPRLANRHDVQATAQLLEIVTGTGGTGLKSYLVYLVPALAMVLGTAAYLAHRRRVVCGIVGGVALVVAGVGWWRLTIASAGTWLVAIQIEIGLWLSIAAYVGLALASLTLAALPQASQKP